MCIDELEDWRKAQVPNPKPKTQPTDPPDYEYDGEGQLDELEMEEMFDCGMDRHGNCGKAGSEECDFECPYRDIKRN